MPNPQQIREICALGALDERTVKKSYTAPQNMRSAAWERVARAAGRVGAEPPPKPAKFAGERRGKP